MVFLRRIMFQNESSSSTFSSSEEDSSSSFSSFGHRSSVHRKLLKINDKPNQNDRLGSIRGWILWLFLFALMVLFFLIANCWSDHLGGIFSDHHFTLKKIAEQNDFQANKKKASGPCPPFAPIRASLPSLMAKPMKKVSESITVQSLTVEKVEQLFRIADHWLSQKNLMQCSDRQFWNDHHESYLKRKQRLQQVCKRYGFADRIFTTWHLSTNRKTFPIRIRGTSRLTNQTTSKADDHKYCNTRNCPLLVNADHQLLTCFVQKVASTTIKYLYRYLDQKNLTHDQRSLEPVNNLTNFHYKVNDELYRISPTFLAYSKEANYFKTIFVRHPFVRVVSAFKDKAEKSPEEEAYFYQRYWNPLLDRLHGPNRDPKLRITFREFVEELLLPTDPYQYDEHWAPIWTRCEPCFVHYDFIGKLETGEEDFRNFKSRANKNLINMTVWENLNEKFGGYQKPATPSLVTTGRNESSINNHESGSARKLLLNGCQQQRWKYAETIRYLRQLSPNTLIELYKRYYLDFELFGYSLDELFKMIGDQ